MVKHTIISAKKANSLQDEMDQLTALEEELRRREREAETIRSALRSSPLAGEEPGEDLLDKARADSRRSARLLRETHDAAPGRMWLVCFVLAAENRIILNHFDQRILIGARAAAVQRIRQPVAVCAHLRVLRINRKVNDKFLFIFLFAGQDFVRFVRDALGVVIELQFRR